MHRPPPSSNRILSLLPPGDYQRLSQRLQYVSLPVTQPIYRVRAPIEVVYFPTGGVISAMTVMEDGSAIEVATVGNEGMVGLTTIIGGDSSPNEVMMQVEGHGYQMSAGALKEEMARDGALRRLLVRYHTAYSVQVSYGVACNGLHKIEQRCCRWLLMTADRVGSNTMSLTHEFLGIMLGVRRSSVTEVLRPLQERGLIGNTRGEITILNRPGVEATSCECYRAIKDEFIRLFGS